MVSISRLTAEDLMQLAKRIGAPRHACCVCAGLDCPGWESLPSYRNGDGLREIGTLVDGDIESATFSEYRDKAKHYWSAEAPIASLFYPYNRCSVWSCEECERLFLRYTEFGGYYRDERIREVNFSLILSTALQLASVQPGPQSL